MRHPTWVIELFYALTGMVIAGGIGWLVYLLVLMLRGCP